MPVFIWGTLFLFLVFINVHTRQYKNPMWDTKGANYIFIAV